MALILSQRLTILMAELFVELRWGKENDFNDEEGGVEGLQKFTKTVHFLLNLC